MSQYVFSVILPILGLIVTLYREEVRRMIEKILSWALGTNWRRWNRKKWEKLCAKFGIPALEQLVDEDGHIEEDASPRSLMDGHLEARALYATESEKITRKILLVGLIVVLVVALRFGGSSTWIRETSFYVLFAFILYELYDIFSIDNLASLLYKLDEQIVQRICSQ